MAKRMKLNIAEGGKLSVEEPVQSDSSEKRKVNLSGTVIHGENNKFRFLRENLHKDIDEFHNTFFQEIISMGLTAKNTDKVINLSEKLIETQKNAVLNTLKREDQANNIIIQTINETSQYMAKQIEQISTSAKRLAQFRKDPMFVEPKEISLGMKWRTTASSVTDLPSNKLVSSTCQFVSITETLKAVFSQKEFQSMYMNYNSDEIHKCESGVFVNFCCGSTYQSKPIYQNPYVIQIQIGMLFYLKTVKKSLFS